MGKGSGLLPGWMSRPESEGQMPDESRLSDRDYWRMISETIGERQTALLQMIRKLELAEDRSETQRFVATDITTGLANNKTVALKQAPFGPWRSVVIPRPSFSELFGVAYSSDLYAIVDGIPYIVSSSGITTIPVYGQSNHQIGLSAGTSAPPSAGWAVDIVWTTRQYELTQYAGF